MNKINIFNYVYPPRCPVCDEISTQGICDFCREELILIKDMFCLKCGKPLQDERAEFCDDCKRRKHQFVQGRSLYSYQGKIRKSLYRLKYGNKRAYAEVYAREMVKELGEWIRYHKIQMIVPIPLHKARKRERGYNQAECIARSLGKQMGIPVRSDLLMRRKNTKPQKHVSGMDRRNNLKEAFVLKKTVPSHINILLVDDIYTTGSTVDAAALSIQRETGCSIYVLTVAIGG